MKAVEDIQSDSCTQEQSGKRLRLPFQKGRPKLQVKRTKIVTLKKNKKQTAAEG